VLDNAKIFNKEPYNELLRVIIHGVLHLCGYNDKSEGEEKIMRQKEDFYLARY
jgi:rRNA maturation RNase YbeY